MGGVTPSVTRKQRWVIGHSTPKRLFSRIRAGIHWWQCAAIIRSHSGRPSSPTMETPSSLAATSRLPPGASGTTATGARPAFTRPRSTSEQSHFCPSRAVIIAPPPGIGSLARRGGGRRSRFLFQVSLNYFQFKFAAPDIPSPAIHGCSQPVTHVGGKQQGPISEDVFEVHAHKNTINTMILFNKILIWCLSPTGCWAAVKIRSFDDEKA